MPQLTLARSGPGQDAYEALYVDGVLHQESEDGPFTSWQILEIIAGLDGHTRVSELTVDADYDDRVIAASGWPAELGEIPGADERDDSPPG